MRKILGTTFGWLALALLLGANVALAKEVEAVPSELWTCGTIIAPGGGEQSICIDFLYDECDCAFCVLDCP